METGYECMTSGVPIPGLLHPSHVTSGSHVTSLRLLHFSTKQSSQLPHLIWPDEDSSNEEGARPAQTVAHSRALEGAETEESRGRAPGPKQAAQAARGKQAQAASAAAASILQGLWPRRLRASGLL